VLGAGTEAGGGHFSKSIPTPGGTVTVNESDGGVTLEISAPYQPYEMSARLIAYLGTRGISLRVQDFPHPAPFQATAAAAYTAEDSLTNRENGVVTNRASSWMHDPDRAVEKPGRATTTCPGGRSKCTNAKPHDCRGASRDRHIAMASFRCVTATCAGFWSPASGSTC